MSVGLPEDSQPKTFQTPHAGQEEYQDMREFSFGQKSHAAADEDCQRDESPDSGSSPNLNVFYARANISYTVVKPYLPLIKEEPDMIKTESGIKQESSQQQTKTEPVTNYRTVIRTCRATSTLISASFRETCPNKPLQVLKPKQRKKLRKMLFTMDDLMFLAS